MTKVTRVLLVCAAALAVTCGAANATPDTTTHGGDDQQAVRHVEDQVTAALGHNDADALSTLWATDYTFVNPEGIVLTRDKRLAMLRSGELKIETYSRDDESIRVYGSTAVVTYRSTVAAARNGKDISSSRRVITVLVKRDGRWQVVAQQSTRVATK
jgi:uncharacterized protein (TIGR02246 family)